MGAENGPGGLLDFAGSSKCVATEVYLRAAKPVLGAGKREGKHVGGEHGRLWCRDSASRRRCGLTFRDKSLIVLCLLVFICNSGFPRTATLSFWVRSVRIPPCESSHSYATRLVGSLVVLSISTRRTGKTTIASLDNTWLPSPSHVRMASLKNPAIKYLSEPRLDPELSEPATDH